MNDTTGAKKAHQPPLPCGQVLNQRLGEGHPDSKPRPAVILGRIRMQSKPRERPAVYPAFALRATRGSSSLEDQTSSFSTHEFMALRNLRVACQKRWRTNAIISEIVSNATKVTSVYITNWKLHLTVDEQGRSDEGGYIGIYIHPQNQ